MPGVKDFHILFLCTGNSCRSQMAEGWARALALQCAPNLSLRAHSAGLEAHGLNPRAVEAMSRLGVEIGSQTSDVVDDAMVDLADLVVTVCSHADAHCPILPADKAKKHIPFTDPAKATGTTAEIDACFDAVCLQIRDAIEDLLCSLPSVKD